MHKYHIERYQNAKRKINHKQRTCIEYSALSFDKNRNGNLHIFDTPLSLIYSHKITDHKHTHGAQ